LDKTVGCTPRGAAWQPGSAAKLCLVPSQNGGQTALGAGGGEVRPGPGRAVPGPCRARPGRAVPGRVEPRVSVRELDRHGAAGASFPTSRMPASVV
jgi:hypothetical protein